MYIINLKHKVCSNLKSNVTCLSELWGLKAKTIYDKRKRIRVNTGQIALGHNVK